jgi:hypothetical protein
MRLTIPPWLIDLIPGNLSGKCADDSFRLSMALRVYDFDIVPKIMRTCQPDLRIGTRKIRPRRLDEQYAFGQGALFHGRILE